MERNKLSFWFLILLAFIVIGAISYFFLTKKNEETSGSTGGIGGGSTFSFNSSNNTINVKNTTTSSATNIDLKNNEVQNNTTQNFNKSGSVSYSSGSSVFINIEKTDNTLINKKGETLAFAATDAETAKDMSPLDIAGYSSRSFVPTNRINPDYKQKVCFAIIGQLSKERDTIIKMEDIKMKAYILDKLRYIPNFGGLNYETQKKIIENIINALKNEKQLDPAIYCNEILGTIEEVINPIYAQCLVILEGIIMEKLTNFNTIKERLNKIPMFVSISQENQTKVINMIIQGIKDGNLSKEKICSLITSLIMEALEQTAIYQQCIATMEKLSALSVLTYNIVESYLVEIPGFTSLSVKVKANLINAILKDHRENGKLNAQLHCINIASAIIGFLHGTEAFQQCIKILDYIIQNNITESNSIFTKLKEIPGFNLLSKEIQEKILEGVLYAISNGTLEKEKTEICQNIAALILDAANGNYIFQACYKVIEGIVNSGKTKDEAFVRKELLKIPNFKLISESEVQKIVKKISEIDKNGDIHLQISNICVQIASIITESLIGSVAYKQCILAIEGIIANPQNYLKIEDVIITFENSITGFKILDLKRKQEIAKIVLDALKAGTLSEQKHTICLFVASVITEALEKNEAFQSCVKSVNGIINEKIKDPAKILSIMQKEIYNFKLLPQSTQEKYVTQVIAISPPNVDEKVQTLCANYAKEVEDLKELMQCPRVILSIVLEEKQKDEPFVIEKMSSVPFFANLKDQEKRSAIVRKIGNIPYTAGVVSNGLYSSCEERAFAVKLPENTKSNYIYILNSNLSEIPEYSSFSKANAEALLKKIADEFYTCSKDCAEPSKYTTICTQDFVSKLPAKNSKVQSLCENAIASSSREGVAKKLLLSSLKKIDDFKPLNSIYQEEITSMIAKNLPCEKGGNSCSKNITKACQIFVDRVKVPYTINPSQTQTRLARVNETNSDKLAVKPTKEQEELQQICVKKFTALDALANPSYTTLLNNKLIEDALNLTFKNISEYTSLSVNSKNIVFNLFKEIAIEVRLAPESSKFNQICNTIKEESKTANASFIGNCEQNIPQAVKIAKAFIAKITLNQSLNDFTNKATLSEANYSLLFEDAIKTFGFGSGFGKIGNKDLYCQSFVQKVEINSEVIVAGESGSSNSSEYSGPKIQDIINTAVNICKELQTNNKIPDKIPDTIKPDKIPDTIKPDKIPDTIKPVIVKPEDENNEAGGTKPTINKEQQTGNAGNLGNIKPQKSQSYSACSVLNKQIFDAYEDYLYEIKNGIPSIAANKIIEINDSLPEEELFIPEFYIQKIEYGLVEDFNNVIIEQPNANYNNIASAMFNRFNGKSFSIIETLTDDARATFISRLYKDKNFLMKARADESLIMNYIVEIGKCTNPKRDIDFWKIASQKMKDALEAKFETPYGFAQNMGKAKTAEELSPVFLECQNAINNIQRKPDSALETNSIKEFKRMKEFDLLPEAFRGKIVSDTVKLIKNCNNLEEKTCKQNMLQICKNFANQNVFFKASNPPAPNFAKISGCYYSGIEHNSEPGKMHFQELSRASQDLVVEKAWFLMLDFQISAKEKRRQIIEMIWNATERDYNKNIKKPVPVSICESAANDVWGDYKGEELKEVMQGPLSEINELLAGILKNLETNDVTTPPSDKCKCYMEKIYAKLENAVISDYNSCRSVNDTSKNIAFIKLQTSQYINSKMASLQSQANFGVMEEGKNLCLILFNTIQDMADDIGEAGKFLANQADNKTTLNQICVQQLRGVFTTISSFRKEYFGPEDSSKYRALSSCNTLKD